MAKKEKKTEVIVELLHTPANGAKKTMWRGGRLFEVKKPQLLELTDEEVELYQNASRFKVSDPSDSENAEASGEASDSEADSSDGDSGEEANDGSEDQGSEDSDSDDEEADSGSDSEVQEDEDDNDSEAQLKSLLQEKREDLNAKALELGVENPDRKEWNKPEVAQAIVEAQANQANGGATS